jgi:hypothetical protein
MEVRKREVLECAMHSIVTIANRIVPPWMVRTARYFKSVILIHCFRCSSVSTYLVSHFCWVVFPTQ